jgi:hypothetical protein
MIVDFIKGADLVDSITITNNGIPIDITELPGFEVWYYTRKDYAIRFSKTNKEGYKLFTVSSSTNYKAYLESADTILLGNGKLYSDVYIATTNSDLAKGNFVNYGTVALEINIVDKPISLRV